MPSKKVGWLIGALVAIAGAMWYRSQVFSQPEKPSVRIAFVTGGTGPYWQIITNGARAAAKDNHVTVTLETPSENESAEQQAKLLESLDLKAFDGVAISPLDSEGQTAVIDRMAKDVVVVTFDSDAPKSKRMSYVGTSNLQAGRHAGELAKQAAPNGGKVAVLVANNTKENLIERRQGFGEVMSASLAAPDGSPPPAYKVLDDLVDEGDYDRCREQLKKILASNEDLACLVGLNAFHGPIIVEVLKKENKLSKVAVVAFDEAPETLDGIESGAIYAAVVQDPYRYGYETVTSLAALCRGTGNARPMTGSYSTFNIATMSVKKDTLADFRKQLAERSGAGDAEK